MRNAYGWNDILVMPDDVREFAWSAPMRDLATKLDISDVGLKKLLTSHGIPTPPQGYWNKVHAGKPVPSVPKAPPRRPGESGRLRLDRRFEAVLTPVAPLPSSGPFASAAVPEDLEELRAVELQALGRASVPKSLDGAHRGLQDILAKEDRRRAKVAKSDWHWDAPQFDNPLAKRRLRILNGIFQALSKRGHSGSAHERDGEIHAGATVGDTYVGIDIGVHGKHRTVRLSGYLRPAPDLPASTPLAIRLNHGAASGTGDNFVDDENGKLEQKLPLIVASIIVAGEAQFRRGLREAEERAELARLAEEKRRQEKLIELNRARVGSLFESGQLLRQAQDIRALVAGVREAIVIGTTISESDVAAWERWALAEADKIDPIRSAQFMSHFREPKLDGD